MRLALAGLAVFVAAGCAHQPATRHALEWRELTSRHFVLRTDLSAGDGRAALADFERTYSILQALAFSSDPPRDRIDVVLFESDQQFRKLAPAGAEGYFMPRQVADPDPAPTIALHGSMLAAGTFVEATQRRFRHELTHRFLDHHVRSSPPWLEEGLAEYYSTLEMDFNEAVVGTLPNQKILRVDIHPISSLGQAMEEERLEFRQLPTVRDLVNADYGTFHQPGRELPFYAGSWVFVHMLLNGPFGYADRFLRYVDLLANGTSSAEAWHSSFDGVSLAVMEQQFRRYIRRDQMDERFLDVKTPPATEPEQVRRMTPDEVHLLMARIRPWDSRENIFAAGDELAVARRLAGPKPSAEMQFWNALYDLRWRRFADAESEVRAALAQEPTQARYWLLLCELLSRHDRPTTPDSAQLDDAVAHLRPLARSAQALNYLARYYSDRGRVEEGLPFAERAVATERGCWECADTLVQLQHSQHEEPPVQPDAYTKPGIY